MIALTGMFNLNRAIIAGSDGMELYLALRRRGYIRMATTATCRIPKPKHAVGLVAGRALANDCRESAGSNLTVPQSSAAIAVLIDCRESGFCLKIRARLEQMGFRIEAGVRCEQGLVLLRHNFH